MGGKRGYLKKSRDEADQRVVNLLLTESGARILRNAPSPARCLLREALATLYPKETRKALCGTAGAA